MEAQRAEACLSEISSTNIFLDGKLPRKELDQGSKVDINGSSQPKKYFCCNYCKKKFPTSYAMGGHQKAHKHERFLEDVSRRAGTNPPALRQPYTQLYPYPHVASNGYFKRSLGIRVHPYFSWSLAGPRYGNGGWSRPSVMNTQPEIARLATRAAAGNGGFRVPGVARFEGGASVNFLGNSPAIPQAQYGASNSAANMGVGSSHRWEGGVMESQQSEKEHELDLTLKL